MLQAGISLSLIWSNTAFADEARQLWVGHLQLQHWLHGAPGQNFNLDLSGAPVIYPPLVAIANAIGGLAGARILSLIFMLGATVLLYWTASRLFGHRAAVAAAALWAVSLPSLKLGAFATYDSMAVFLLCLATWLAVQAAYRKRAPELAVLAALVMVVADLTAYSYAIYDVVVIVVAVCAWRRQLRAARVRELLLWLIGAVGSLGAILPTLMRLWSAIIAVTITRNVSPAANPALEHQAWVLVAQLSWNWSGIVAILGLAGAITAAAAREHKRVVWLLATLSASAFLVPLYQLHLETGWALDKHLASGVWFAAIPAGYLVSKVAQIARPRRPLAALAGMAALAYPAASGWQYAYSDYHSWQNASALVDAVQQIHMPANAHLLAGLTNGSTEVQWILDYYVVEENHNGPAWGSGPAVSFTPAIPAAKFPAYYRTVATQDKFNEVALTFPVPTTAFSMQPNGASIPGAAQIRQDLVGLIAADPSTAQTYDLAAALEADPNYQLVGLGPFRDDLGAGSYMVWKLR